MTAKIKLNAASGGGSVSLKAPTSTTSNAAVELQLPIADGTNGQVIKTNGSGVLSFGADTGGKVLQVIQAVKTDRQTSTSDSFIDITGLSASITPSATSSKVLVQVNLTFGGTKDRYSFGRVLRDSTAIDIAPNVGARESLGFSLQNHTQDTTSDNKVQTMSYFFLDSPSTTSATTYKVQVRNYSGDTSREFTINGTQVDNNVAYNMRGTSKIMLSEIGA